MWKIQVHSIIVKHAVINEYSQCVPVGSVYGGYILSYLLMTSVRFLKDLKDIACCAIHVNRVPADTLTVSEFRYTMAPKSEYDKKSTVITTLCLTGVDSFELQ